MLIAYQLIVKHVYTKPNVIYFYDCLRFLAKMLFFHLNGQVFEYAFLWMMHKMTKYVFFILLSIFLHQTDTECMSVYLHFGFCVPLGSNFRSLLLFVAYIEELNRFILIMFESYPNSQKGDKKINQFFRLSLNFWTNADLHCRW